MMSLLPGDRFNQLMNVKKEVEQMFSSLFDLSFFDNMLGNLGNMGGQVQETDTEVIATFNIPGLKKEDDIHIHVDYEVLTIKGINHTTTEINDGNMIRTQQYASSFYRSIHLPSPVSRDGVKATYINGVLEVRMKKSSQNIIPKKIDIDFY